MVQMKVRIRKSKRVLNTVLYIPHGSDESRQKVVPAFFVDVFISHMVQMKVLDVRPFSKAITSLYPTWFR